MDAFIAWSKQTANEIAKTVNPSLDLSKRATAGWALTELHEALLIIAGYAVLVTIGMILYRMQKRPGGGSKGRKPRGALTWSEVGTKCSKQPLTMTLRVTYNLIQVAVCIWMVVFSAQQAWEAGYPQYAAKTGLLCVPHELMPAPGSYKAHHQNLHLVLWVFYATKVLDFVDTLFIVALGNWSQFTFLHVFHHFSIFAFYWLNTFAAYDGDIWWTIVANGTIHAIMYWYYALTTLGAKPVWKSLLTYSQLLQFVTMMTQAIVIISNAESCAFPRPVAATYFFYILFLFVLFVQFAMENYCTPKPKKD